MKCHDCYAEPGQFHIPGCDMEICQRCGGQAISCDCIYVVNGIDPDTMEDDYPEIWTRGPTDEMYDKFNKLYPNRIPYLPSTEA
jgi:hypothetical protein